jgi:uncharacterized membrane-anchored protein YjiN (DUF445 family)
LSVLADVAGEDALAGLKRAGLRKMQQVSIALLAMMLVLLFLSVHYQSAYPWLHWVRAAAEAAVVGAIADWYAVVALFRHPLGIPVPHTAIIPRKKDSIGESLGTFVEQNFLTPDNIVRKLAQHNAARSAAEWLAESRNSRTVAETIADLIPAAMNALADKDVRTLFDKTIVSQLLQLDVARVAGRVLELLMDGNRHHATLERVLTAMEKVLTQNEERIRVKFGEASRFTPRIFDAYIVRKFVAGVVALLREVKADPEHELWREFDAAARKFIENLKTSPDYRDKGRVLMQDFIRQLANDDYYAQLWSDLRRRIENDLRRQDSVIKEQVAIALASLASGVLSDRSLQDKLNAWLAEAGRGIVSRHGHQISSLISDVVKSWDAKDVSRKLELELGPDLQFIRINGTLVGGSIGIVLHAIALFVSG